MAKTKKGKKTVKRAKTVVAKAKAFRAAAAKRRVKLVPKKAAKKEKAAPTEKVNPKLQKRIDEQNKKAEALMVRGRERGFVTYDEILKAFPNIEDDVMFLEDLYEKFSTAKIDVLEGGGMLCKLLQCRWKIDTLYFFYKGKDISFFAATKAHITPPLGTDHKRGRLFFMEGATRPVVAPRALELDVLPHHFNNREAVFDFFYIRVCHIGTV